MALLVRVSGSLEMADTLPCEERSGLTGSTSTFQNMLVFRREISGAAHFSTERTAAPVADTGTPARKMPEAPVVLKPSAATPAPTSAPDAAAAAAAAALTAYRESASSGPKLGPAPERRPDRGGSRD